MLLRSVNADLATTALHRPGPSIKASVDDIAFWAGDEIYDTVSLSNAENSVA